MKKAFAILFLCATSFADGETIEKRYTPNAETASTVGNAALWHNPAGLAFMGGAESSIAYLHEWSKLGNRHHGGFSLSYNLWQFLTFASGINTQAAFSEDARHNLGTDLSGIFGMGLRLSRNFAFGLSFLKTYHFLHNQSSPVFVGFGFQARPWSFLSMGAHYEEVNEKFFGSPNITAGVAIRPYKEYVTIGLDTRFRAQGEEWRDGFRIDPILSLRTDICGYGAGINVEIPGLKDGFKKPIFGIALDINFAHLGLSLTSVINPHQNNYGVGTSIRASSDRWTSVMRPQGQWVELTIDNNGLIDRAHPSLAERLFSQTESPLAVLSLLRRIEADKSVGGVVLNINGMSFGDGRTQEWRDAILSLRAAQKTVVVYLDSPSERDYYIASAANKIMMNKQSSLSFRRFRATLVYFADLLEKIGVKADAITAGSYKTAPRTFTNSRPQKEEIEVANNILTNFYDRMITDVAASRNIERIKLTVAFDKGEISAIAAKDLGLVDEIIDADSALNTLAATDELTLIAAYEKRTFKQNAWHEPRKIVVIPISNTIIDGRSAPGIFSSLFPVTGAKDIVEQIEIAQADPQVAGIIVRIDSPGGDPVASHRINEALVRAQKSKAVVASMGDVAASGGYLVAVGAKHIVAEHNTITGSIGVFSLMFSAEKLASRIGVNSLELSPIKNPGPSLLRSISESERAEAQRITNWYYDNFIQAVSAGLTIEKDDVRKVAEGRAWLGHEAFEKKLVHELGGFSNAVDAVRKIANVPDAEVLDIDVRMPGDGNPLSFGMRLKSLFTSQKNDRDLDELTKLAGPYLQALEAYRINGTPQARLPFHVEWKKK